MRKSICIVHGNDLGIPNAGTNRVLALTRALYENGFDVHLVIPRPSKKLPEDIKEVSIHTAPVEVKGTLNKIPRAILLLLRARKVSKKYNSVVQIQLSTLGGIASIIGYRNYVLEMNDLAFESPVYTDLPFSPIVRAGIYKMERSATIHACKIIVVSKSLKNFLIKEWGVPEEKIEVIPNGYFRIKIDQLKKQNSSEIDDRMIVRTGSLFRHLDVDLLIRLSKSLGDEYKIYLVGDGELRQYLEKRIGREGVKNIIITGWLPYEEAMKMTNRALITFDAVKRSLTTEVACPVKILDYAALGKPIVLSDVSDLSKTFKKRKAALVSEPENKKEFIENVNVLLKNKEVRDRIALAASNLVKDFTWEEAGKKLVRIYEELL